MSKADAATVLHGGFLGGPIDPLPAADSEPKSIRGHNPRYAPGDQLVCTWALSSPPPRLFPDLPLHFSLVQVDPPTQFDLFFLFPLS
ncbi:hypothetical protein V6N13_126031 [Hibiscus sabdariffa]|uniref:Uncharacterized protein n=1 Tax=Hibiscus sabdariffa TaxID=183260 RepID=A0ABR2A487_9ROSI